MGWRLCPGSFGAPSMKDVGWGRWLFVMGFVALLCAAYSMPLPSARMHLGDCSCDRVFVRCHGGYRTGIYYQTVTARSWRARLHVRVRGVSQLRLSQIDID